MDKPENSDSDLLLLTMDPSEEGHHDTPIDSSYGMHDSGLLLSAPLTTSHYSINSSKIHCELLRNESTSEYLVKDAFMDGMSNDMSLAADIENRYRHARQMNPNFTKIESTPFELKSLQHDIHDISFVDDLRSLNREVAAISTYNYYQKTDSPSSDIYGPDFSNEFPGGNFANSLPSTSGIFSQDDETGGYILPENHSDELLLNSIELNENEKLILSNEEIAILTQGKPGSCLELILNNGEVLYAVIDPENELDSSSSSRSMQVSKELRNPVRQCSVPVAMETDMVNQLPGTHYDNVISDSSSFTSKSSAVDDFNVNTTCYHSVISTSMSKTINSSPISSESFNLCCDFNASTVNQFSSNVDSYSSMVTSKPGTSYNQSLLGKTDVTFCTSAGSPNKVVSGISSDSKLLPSSPIEPAASKIDYFPSAVNSIVVSETGKKYPKKYSFYSNNFSTFLNQASPFDKDCRPTSSESSKLCQLPCDASIDRNVRSLAKMGPRICADIDPANDNVHAEAASCSHLSNETEMQAIGQMITSSETGSGIAIPLKRPNEPFYSMNIEEDNCVPGMNREIMAKSTSCEDEVMKNKFLNSRSTSTVNSICDRAVQSRARATLPSEYLSINRIKSNSSGKKSVYGVFARKTIPSRTQFGPLEGVLIKEEEDRDDRNEDETGVLQLTIRTEKGKFWRLDVSNEDICNWMRYVRPASAYTEQNLILSQQDSALYFTTIEVVHPKQELLVWYSAWYARIRNYKLLPADPCADVPYEIIQQDDELSTVFKSNKSAPEESLESNTPRITAEQNDILHIDDVEGAKSRTEESTSSRPTSLIKNTPEEVPSSNKKQRFAKKPDKSIKGLWLCTYCDLTFSNSSVMNIHVLVHVSCEQGDTKELLSNGNNLDNHCCPQCNQNFLDKFELVTHVSKHGLKVQRWSDNKTAESSSTSVQRNNEDTKSEASSLKNYECQFCKKSFKNPTALSIHERVHSDNLLLECPICDATFQKLMAMKEHVHTHAKDGIFTCPHCPKTYDGYKFIRKHIRSCHVTAKYICKQCKKSFRSQHKLRNHMLKHSDKREFLCANCGKQFKRRDKLTGHIKNIHSEEREKKSLEIMKSAMEAKSAPRKALKKLPAKVLRLITENVNDYFYKCYVCNIGFKRRGMLVNHINSLHPGVSLDSIPELNVPILKAYCNFFCLYCDRVYKSSSKRKAHIIKSHPGAKIPDNSERGMVLNNPYAKHVGSVILNPFNCEFCYRQYASRAKLLNHHRKEHADLLPPEMKFPKHGNSQKKKKKLDSKPDTSTNIISKSVNDGSDQTVPHHEDAEFKIDNNVNVVTNTSTANAAQESMLSLTSSKDNLSDPDQTMGLQQLLNEELRNSISQEQYLKILQSFNGITIAQTDENSSALLQQILTSYSFSNS